MPSTLTDRLQGLTTSLAIKPPCVAVTSAAITLSGLQTVGGVALAEDDRVLVKDQADAEDNGIYNASSGTWQRAKDFDGNRDVVQGTLVLVRNGVADGAIYEVTTANPIVIGTTELTFELRDDPAITYVQTLAEIAALVTPVATTLEPLIVDRYATNTTPGTTNMTTALNNALAVAGEMADAGLYGTVKAISALAISSTIVVENGVTLDLQNNPVTPLSTSLNMFEVRPGGQIRNLRVNVEGIAYTGKVATLKGDGGVANGFQGTLYRPWLVGYDGRMALDTTDGEHLFLDGREQYLQEFTAERIAYRGGGVGIHLLGDQTDVGNLEYVQGNTFRGVTSHGTNKYIWCEGTATAGNNFLGLMLQQRNANPICKVVLESAGNVLQGKAWDDIPIESSADGNVIDLIQSQQYGPAITDTARNTVARSRGTNYYDLRSINSYGDVRHELHGPGLIEFHEHIMGGFDAKWGSAVTSGSPTAAFGYATFGAAANHKQAMPYMRITCPGSTTDSYARNFGGNGFLRCAQNPTVHFTWYTAAGDSRLRFQCGLYTDASNYILLIQDQTTYSDDDIRLVTRSGGTSTTTVLTGTAGSRVNFCTLLIKEASVIALVKQYDNASSGAAGRVDDGALWTGTGFFTATATANIPTTSAMFPYLFVQHATGASDAVVDFLHYSFLAGAKATVA